MLRLAQQTRRLIERYGTPITYTRTTQGAFDPVTGTYGPGETATHEIKASAPADYAQDAIDGTLVQTGDFKLLIAAADLPFVPRLSSSDTQDTITLDATDYNIIRVWPLYAGDDPISYRIQARQ